MIVPSMTDKEILDHIIKDNVVAESFITRQRKSMNKVMRSVISRNKQFNRIVGFTSHVSKQKYVFVFSTDNRNMKNGLCYAMFAVVGFGSNRKYICAVSDNHINVVTSHFVERYIERMHLPEGTTQEEALLLYFTNNSYTTAIYSDDKSFVKAGMEGLALCTDDSEYCVTSRTFVSMDMLKKSQKEAVEKVIDKLFVTEDGIRYLYKQGKTIEDAAILAGMFMEEDCKVAEEIYKQYFKKKSYNMVY